MKWKLIESSYDTLLTVTDVMAHLRVDDVAEKPYLETLIAAATAHAEELLECSLLTRTLEATFFAGERMYLPRGPVQEISSVTIDGQFQRPNDYCIESYGNNDLLCFRGSTIQPFSAPKTIVCTYDAGFGEREDIPADILQVVRCHVGLLYEQRELATDRTVTPVPFIADFYRLRGRGAGVG